MRWKILIAPLCLVLVLAVAQTTPAQPGEPAAVTDQETVFVELGPTGSIDRVMSVSWLRVFGDGQVRVADPVPGEDPRPLAGTPRPREIDGQLVWELDVDGVADLFVTATPTQDLPLDVAVRYFVDGEQVPAEQAQGAAGRVRLEGTITNLTEPFVPMVASVSFSLPVASFITMDPGEGREIAVGRSMQLSYVVVPRPEGTFELEVETRRAQIPAMSITAFPQPPQEMELLQTLNELRDRLERFQTTGLGSLQAGAAGLGAGASQGLSGAAQLQETLSALGRIQGAIGGAGFAGQLDSAALQGLGALVPDRQGRAAGPGHPSGAQHQSPTPEQPPAGGSRARDVAADIAGRPRGDGSHPPRPAQPAPATGSPGAQGIASQLQDLATAAQAPSLTPDLAALGLGNLPDIGQAQSAIGQLTAGLAQIQAAAGQLAAGLAEMEAQGLGDLMGDLEGLDEQAVDPEEAARAAAYDTFTGKPEGADGEVRFIYRVAAPLREAEIVDDVVIDDDEDRAWWRRILGLLPGID